MNIELLFLKALFATILSESIALVVLIKGPWWRLNVGWPLLFFSGFFASFSTLPYLWFIFPAWIKNHSLFVLGGEFFVFFIEMIVYYFVLIKSWKKAAILSLVCNLFSILVGKVIF